MSKYYTYETGVYWRDVYGDDDLQQFLQDYTVVALEEEIRRILRWERKHYYIARNLQLDYRALVNRDIDSHPMRYMVNVAWWIGGERGQRIGRERAKRMIAEAYAFADAHLRAKAPWLYDGEQGVG